MRLSLSDSATLAVPTRMADPGHERAGFPGVRLAPFPRFCREHCVRMIDPDYGPVGGNRLDAEAVDLVELERLR
jgi:hypothetical protein